MAGDAGTRLRARLPRRGHRASARVPRIQSAAESATDRGRRDLRDRLWCSIDNEESRDLDQLTVAEQRARRHRRSSLRSPTSTRWSRAILPSIDTRRRTPRRSTRPLKCSRCCPSDSPRTSPRLPRRRPCSRGRRHDGRRRRRRQSRRTCFSAIVRNRAKLAYPSVGAWLDGDAPAPTGIETTPGLADNLRLQDAAAPRAEAVASQARSADPRHRGRQAGLRRRRGSRHRGAATARARRS